MREKKKKNYTLINEICDKSSNKFRNGESPWSLSTPLLSKETIVVTEPLFFTRMFAVTVVVSCVPYFLPKFRIVKVDHTDSNVFSNL